MQKYLYNVKWTTLFSADQGFMQDFELGGKQDGSRLIEACMATREVWGLSPPPQSGELFEFRSSQIASDAIWDKLFQVTHTSSGWGGGFQGPHPSV